MARYKSSIVVVIVFAIVYSLIIMVVAPFLVSWGDKPNFLEKTIDALMTFPINWKSLIIEKSLFYIFPNGLFWGFMLATLIYVIKRIF